MGIPLISEIQTKGKETVRPDSKLILTYINEGTKIMGSLFVW